MVKRRTNKPTSTNSKFGAKDDSLLNNGCVVKLKRQSTSKSPSKSIEKLAENKPVTLQRRSSRLLTKSLNIFDVEEVDLVENSKGQEEKSPDKKVKDESQSEGLFKTPRTKKVEPKKFKVEANSSITQSKTGQRRSSSRLLTKSLNIFDVEEVDLVENSKGQEEKSPDKKVEDESQSEGLFKTPRTKKVEPKKTKVEANSSITQSKTGQRRSSSRLLTKSLNIFDVEEVGLAENSKDQEKTPDKKRKDESQSEGLLKTPRTKTVESKKTKVESNSSITQSKTTSDDIYELQLSQPSGSETEDMTLYMKLEKEGKVRINHNRKRTRKPENNTRAKKKYVNPSKTWHNIEKNLGITSEKSKLKKITKSEQDDDEIKMMTEDICKESSNTLTSGKENQVQNSKQVHVALIHSEPSATSLTVRNETMNKEMESTSEITMNASTILPVEEVSVDNTLNVTHRRSIKDKKHLLEYVKSYINQSKSSTPIANKQKRDGNDNHVALSPILPSSPWKRKRNQILNSSCDDSTIFDVENTTIKNSSNAENIPPLSTFDLTKRSQGPRTAPANTATTTVTQDKSKVSSRSNIILGSRLTPQAVKRSPLKQINILEVINLPPLPLRSRRVDELSSFSFTKTKPNKNDEITRIEDNNKIENDSVANSFGFDEIVDITESSEENNKTVIPEKSSLKRRLTSLKKLLPPLERPLRGKSPLKKVPSLFGESSKQANIRGMLSSTMINKSSTPTVTETIHDGSDNDDKINFEESTIVKDTNNDTVTTIDLFDELVEPETTLDTSKIKRTYSRTRPKKKPRRYFIFFSDDESDKETESESKSRRTRKKQSKPQYNEKELDKFAEEFNSMCEEAESYKLVTEVDTSTLNV